jgi:hypothetical protein
LTETDVDDVTERDDTGLTESDVDDVTEKDDTGLS